MFSLGSVKFLTCFLKARSHGLVVKATYNQEIVDSNPGAVYWMDLSNATATFSRKLRK
jgi:hypothetical protein